MDFQALKSSLPPYESEELRFVSGTEEQEEKSHKFLMSIAKKLISPEEYDFEKRPIFFAVVDDDTPNAAFVPNRISSDNDEKDVTEYTPVIYVTKGLLNLCENEDQLAYILGHELGHMLDDYRQGKHFNSKIEEIHSDISAIDRMARSGYNINEVHKIASHILFNEAEYADLFKILNASLDNHPNNESRLNAIDVSIKSLDDFYQKQNIDLNQVPVTAINTSFWDEIKSQKYVTLFEKKLADRHYETATLEEKQNILIDSIVEFDKENSDWKEIHKRGQISRVIYDYIIELRKQMPRKIVKQSEYEFLISYQRREDEIKREERVTEILGLNYSSEYEERRDIEDALHSFPFQIVSDDEYEKIALENEQKQNLFDRSLQDGTNLNLNFVQKLLELREKLPFHYTSFNGRFSTLEGDYTNFIASALSSINNINVEPYPRLRVLIEDVQNLIEKGISSPDLKNFRFFTGTPFNHRDSGYTNPFPMEYRCYDNEKDGYFYTKFDSKQFIKNEPEMSKKAIGQKIPKCWYENTSLCLELTGISAQGTVWDDLQHVEYNPDYQTPDKKRRSQPWTYLVDKDGVIVDSFPLSEFEEKRREKQEKQSLEYHQKIANLVKQQYALLQKIKANPEIELDISDLFKLKVITGKGFYGKKISILDFWRDEISKIKIENNYYSPIYNEESVLAFLSEEERSFIKEFNPSDDQIVFEAFEKNSDKIFKENNSYLPYFGYKVDSKHVDLKYDLNPNGFSPFSFEQAEKIMRRAWQVFPFERYYLVGSQERFSYPEYYKLSSFIKAEVDKNPNLSLKDIDFKKYNPFVADIVASKLNWPTEKPIDHPISNSLYPACILLHILTDETHTLDMSSVLKTSRFLWPNVCMDVQKEFLPPFIQNRKNWPEDTLQMCRYFKELPSEVYGSDQILWMIEQVQLEQDVQKSLDSALILTKLINKNTNNEDKNRLKDALTKNLRALDTPLEEKIKVYTKLASKNAFSDDYVVQNQLLNDFMSQIAQIKDAEKRSSLCEIFIQNDNRIQDPDIRRRYHQLWVDSVFEACGSQIDDNSITLHQKIEPYLTILHETSIEKVNWGNTQKVKDHISPVDRLEIARLLAEKFVSQQELSERIKPHPTSYESFEQGNKNEMQLQIAGVDFFKYLLHSYPQEADNLIDFLLSKGTLSAAQEYHQHLETEMESVDQTGYLKSQIPSPETFQVMHREFWGYPLEARSVLINDLLHSSAGKSSEERWEGIFNKVADKIFPDGTLQMNKIGKEFLHSYIKARKDSERTLYLSAMMVAANENSGITDPEKALAKGIRLFLENSGPAAIKLGQAMASYTDVPKFIRDEMQYLKSSAARPSRWELYEWLEFYKNQDNDKSLSYGKDVWLGRILGSASYFVTLEKGSFENGKVPQTSDKVTKILRTGAKLSSDKEFKIFEDMLYDVAQKGIMENGIDSFIRLIHQAQESVVVETDLETGHSQLETAKQIYKEKTIELDGYSFKLHVADWPEYGKNWADLERAKGSDLDEIKDLKYKHAASKAYFSIELMNMLSGGRFDHDRHGKQLKINTQNNVIGLFDTGAMAIADPDPKDKELLGQIIYRTLEKTLNNQNKEGSIQGIGATLSAEIEAVYRDKQTQSTYLTECQRGLLALTDFYKDFTVQDFKDCFNAALNNEEMPLDKNILHGFISEGIESVGIFENKHSILSHQDKEDLGRLLFNTYSGTLLNQEKSVGQILNEQVEQMQNTSLKQMPVLQIVANKLKEAQDRSLGLDFPAEFIPTLEKIISDKNLDIAILKGITKEALDTLNLQQEKSAYTPEDRQAFGHLLYDTYAFMVQKSKQKEKADMASVYLELYKTGQYATQLGSKLASILTVAQKIDIGNHSDDINLKEIAKSVLLSGALDSEITKGITDALVVQNKSPLARHLTQKGLKMFLSQKRSEPGLVKRTLIKLFVKDSKALQTKREELVDLLLEPKEREKISKTLQSYFKKFVDSVNKQQVQPNIKISSGR